jgi:reactive intermediate/imine deaminase
MCAAFAHSEEVIMTNRRVAFVLGAVVLLSLPVVLGTLASPPPAKRRVINLPSRTVQAPFSDAILVGDTLYLAGRIGLDPKTNKPPEDAEQEARLVLDGIKSVLAEAGMTMDDLVTVTVYCPEVSNFNKFNGVYRAYFKGDFPARAFIGSGPLLFNAHFEVQAIAVKK